MMHLYLFLSFITVIAVTKSDQAVPGSHDDASDLKEKKKIIIINSPHFTIIRNAVTDFNRLTIRKVVEGGGIH